MFKVLGDIEEKGGQSIVLVLIVTYTIDVENKMDNTWQHLGTSSSKKSLNFSPKLNKSFCIKA